VYPPRMPRGPKPRHPVSRAGLALSLFVGALLTWFGGARAWSELRLNLHGVKTRGHVVDWLLSQRQGNWADVEIASASGAPLRVHLVEVPTHYPWAEGLAVDLVCPEIRAGAAGCEIDDWHRLLVPVGFLAAGVGFLAWGVVSARRSG
jgi:hypothetical protein